MNLSMFIALSGLSAVLVLAAGGEPAAKPVIIDASLQAARTVQVSERDVVSINARLRFTTLIVLPKDENILDFVCGDKEFWVVNGAQNFAFIKPSKAGTQTNLNLITAAGNVYSFTVTENSIELPDVKVFIEPKDGALLSGGTSSPRFVAASALDDYRAQVELARTQASQAKREAAEELARQTAQLSAEVSKLKAEMPQSLKFDYKFENQPGFNVEAIYHDGRMTYIKANPQEAPVLYEYKDDKLNLVEYRLEGNMYIVTKVLDRAVLSMGKRKLHFERKG